MAIAFKADTGISLTLHYAPEPEKPPSGGATIFLALTLGGLAAYFTVGAVVQHRKGETGKGLMIHSEWWATIPGLVKDGCRFTLKKVVGVVAGSAAAAKYESI